MRCGWRPVSDGGPLAGPLNITYPLNSRLVCSRTVQSGWLGVKYAGTMIWPCADITADALTSTSSAAPPEQPVARKRSVMVAGDKRYWNAELRLLVCEWFMCTLPGMGEAGTAGPD